MGNGNPIQINAKGETLYEDPLKTLYTGEGQKVTAFPNREDLRYSNLLHLLILEDKHFHNGMIINMNMESICEKIKLMTEKTC